jgi:hypothetical protein
LSALFGCLMSYIGSAELIYHETFDAGDLNYVQKQAMLSRLVRTLEFLDD